MYFEALEANRTKLWIVNSLLDLLKRKEYASITINMIADNAQLGRRTFYRHFDTKDEAMKYITELLMDAFAANVKTRNAQSYEEIIEAYFDFWEQYIDILLLLKKAHLLYFIDDNKGELILRVARKVKNVPEAFPLEALSKIYAKYYFDFTIKLSGIWEATLVSCEETPRKTPKEMSAIITNLIK